MARLLSAMSDMAETIRRVFQAPPSASVPLSFRVPASTRIPALEVSVLEPVRAFETLARGEPGLPPATLREAPLAFVAQVAGEPGWSAWAAGAKVCELPLFQAEKAQRLTVPALPRKALARRLVLEAMTGRSRSGWSPFAPPPVRAIRPDWTAPRAHGALAQMLTLPVAVTGEDLQKISKALWMRYTLQLVRSTGQNIRNLEVLGLYRIPCKGTHQVHHDPATGRLLVTLGPEAAEAKRAPFILARQKDDNAVVCCFVEEG
jgi:predicted RNA binding protein YcfA (HicA-like mRNA interferase family)